MFPKLITLCSLLCSITINADDSQTNPVAKKIKKTVTQYVNKRTSDYIGYCDIMVEMRHTKNKAIIHKIKTSGDYKVCKLSKKSLKKGRKYSYPYPEKFIRIHITTN
ncbi:hypothetical protein L4C33_15650 [Vibrio makurazakiensis]|uniref:hypothetical protein n=1 Tax=Vibrio makurazakiensis TaxID=2910250 RepID=UPI003D152747